MSDHHAEQGRRNAVGAAAHQTSGISKAEANKIDPVRFGLIADLDRGIRRFWTSRGYPAHGPGQNPRGFR